MRKRSTWGKITSHWVGATVLFNLVGAASAATHDQIIAACREAARPTMIACMQRSRGEGDHDARFEGCRQSVGIPFVKTCVLREFFSGGRGDKGKSSRAGGGVHQTAGADVRRPCRGRTPGPTGGTSAAPLLTTASGTPPECEICGRGLQRALNVDCGWWPIASDADRDCAAEGRRF